MSNPQTPNTDDLKEALTSIESLREMIADCYTEIFHRMSKFCADSNDPVLCTALVDAVDKIVPEFRSIYTYSNMYETDLMQGMDRLASVGQINILHLIELSKAISTGDTARFDPEEVRNMLRSMNYDQYLQTPHWQATRRSALDRASSRCQVCNTNKEQLHVHHRTYENRGAEKPEDLIVLCATCHSTFHKNGRLAK